MKFIDKRSGVISETEVVFVVEQMKKRSDIYEIIEEVKETVKKPVKK